MKEVIVAICDDNPQAIIDLREKIQDSVKEKDLSIKIEEFKNGLALLESNLNPQILFLDIETPGQDGIETARLLRQRDNECRIIMATSRVDRFKNCIYTFGMFGIVLLVVFIGKGRWKKNGV